MQELTRTLERFATQDEIREMFEVADSNKDREISYKEFGKTFQHPAWSKAKMMGKVAAQFEVLSKRQDHMYRMKQRREAERTGGARQDKEILMLRESLSRNLKVRMAISKLWYSLGSLLVDGLWLGHDAYVTLHTRLSEFMIVEFEWDVQPGELMDAGWWS